jgi:hypothetical protein
MFDQSNDIDDEVDEDIDEDSYEGAVAQNAGTARLSRQSVKNASVMVRRVSLYLSL